MKRKTIGAIILLISLTVLLSACGGGATDNRSLSDFKNAYITAGYSLDNESAPFYQAISAKDGTMFNIGNDVIKIYEYSDEKALDKAVKDNAVLSGCVKNGKFLCETSNSSLLSVFEAVKK